MVQKCVANLWGTSPTVWGGLRGALIEALPNGRASAPHREPTGSNTQFPQSPPFQPAGLRSRCGKVLG